MRDGRSWLALLDLKPRAKSRRSLGDAAMMVLRGLAWLLLFQAAGEALARALSWPFPGPVVGMLLLLLALRWRAVQVPVQAAAEQLLAHLSLLFVPVGVGVIMHLDLVSQHGLRLLAVIVVSTWVGLLVTAWVLRAALPKEPATRDGKGTPS
jgi:holin-like protein